MQIVKCYIEVHALDLENIEKTSTRKFL